jgi:hypothetical protein
MAEPGTGQKAVSVPTVPMLFPPAEDPLAVVSLQEDQAAPPLLPEDPPRDEGIALYTLHSVFLI